MHTHENNNSSAMTAKSEARGVNSLLLFCLLLFIFSSINKCACVSTRSLLKEIYLVCLTEIHKMDIDSTNALSTHYGTFCHTHSHVYTYHFQGNKILQLLFSQIRLKYLAGILDHELLCIPTVFKICCRFCNSIY